MDAARIVVADGWGPGYWGAGYWGAGWGGWGGWYWDPWFSAFTFMPAGGIFYSPFGWGFYSPGLVYRAPFYGGHVYHTFNAANVRAWGPGQHYATSTGYAHGVYTGAGAARGAFHSGAAMAGGGLRWRWIPRRWLRRVADSMAAAVGAGTRSVKLSRERSTSCAPLF